MRIALLYSNEELIGKTRAFDGMVLFLPFKLQDQVYLKEKNPWPLHRFRKATYLSVKLKIISYPSVLTYVLGAQKNRVIETVLLSTHNMFCLRYKKIISSLHALN